MRIGMGYDVHRLVPERDLILGGVKIEYEYGLLWRGSRNQRILKKGIDF